MKFDVCWSTRIAEHNNSQIRPQSKKLHRVNYKSTCLKRAKLALAPILACHVMQKSVNYFRQVYPSTYVDPCGLWSPQSVPSLKVSSFAAPYLQTLRTRDHPQTESIPIQSDRPSVAEHRVHYRCEPRSDYDRGRRVLQ